MRIMAAWSHVGCVVGVVTSLRSRCGRWWPTGWVLGAGRAESRGAGDADPQATWISDKSMGQGHNLCQNTSHRAVVSLHPPGGWLVEGRKLANDDSDDWFIIQSPPPMFVQLNVLSPGCRVMCAKTRGRMFGQYLLKVSLCSVKTGLEEAQSRFVTSQLDPRRHRYEGYVFIQPVSEKLGGNVKDCIRFLKKDTKSQALVLVPVKENLTGHKAKPMKTTEWKKCICCCFCGQMELRHFVPPVRSRPSWLHYVWCSCWFWWLCPV